MAKIIPTIGRIVWFHPSKQDVIDGVDYKGQPLAATVVYVKNELFINLHVLDATGNAWKFEDVVLFQESKPWDYDERCAEWMPYQRAQPEKHSNQIASCATDTYQKYINRTN